MRTFPLSSAPLAVNAPLSPARRVTLYGPGAPRVALLGHELWRRRFGAEAGIIGQAIRLDDLSYTVVGVMPPDFNFPDKETELWTPIAFNADAANQRDSFYLSGVARLSPGATLADAAYRNVGRQSAGFDEHLKILSTGD
jgi:hypothetical protein